VIPHYSFSWLIVPGLLLWGALLAALRLMGAWPFSLGGRSPQGEPSAALAVNGVAIASSLNSKTTL
jgi:hypothetical protein